MSKRTALDIFRNLDMLIPQRVGPFCLSEAAEMLRSQAAEIDRLKRERHHIYDLLARIHRDGGQYTAEHGVEKSCDDAEAQVVAWLDTINSVDALIEQARIAEREACAKTCEREAVLYDIRGAYKTGNHCAEEIRARGKS